jgi:transcriptional regulator with XRE-family HTH domain
MEPYRYPPGAYLVPRKELGSELQRLREGHGLSQAEVARRLGLEEDLVARAEGVHFGLMYRTRKLILEGLMGCAIEGPFYLVRPLSGDRPARRRPRRRARAPKPVHTRHRP